MKAHLIAAALAVTCSFSTAAFAQAGKHADKREAKQELRDDRRDLKEIEDIEQRFTKARTRNRINDLKALDAQLQRYVERELAETRKELEDAKRDARRGPSRPGERAEVRQEERALTRLSDLSRDLRPLYGRFDRSSLSRRQQLIAQLVAFARSELRGVPPAPKMSHR